MAAHSFTSFALRAYSWVWRGTSLHLKDWPDEVQRNKVRVPCRPDFLMNEGICLWIQYEVILESWEGAESCCRDQEILWKCFLAQDSRISLYFWVLMSTGLSVSYWRCNNLKGFTHRLFLNTWCMVHLLTPVAVAKVLLLQRGFRRSFSLVSLKSWGEQTFLLRPDLSKVFPVSWNCTIFYTVEWFISSRFWDFNITFSTFVKLNHCISVYSYCKTNVWRFWYT